MNYLASGLDTGFRIGADARENKKKREQEDRLKQAQRDLELQVQANQLAQQKRLQEADQLFRGTEAGKERNWRTGERTGTETFQSGQADKDRAFRSEERFGTETFQAGQSQLDRDARALSQEKAQTFQGGQSQMDRDARAVALDKELASKATAQNWTQSPTNPLNRYYGALADASKGPSLGDVQVSTPYTQKIADIEKQIAGNRTEQALGDNRTGLFNWKSRDSEVSDLQQQLLKLKGLELQHLVETGAISRDEANKRASALLGK